MFKSFVGTHSIGQVNIYESPTEQKLIEELGSEILPPEYGGSGMSVKVDIVDIRYCTL